MNSKYTMKTEIPDQQLEQIAGGKTVLTFTIPQGVTAVSYIGNAIEKNDLINLDLYKEKMLLAAEEMDRNGYKKLVVNIDDKERIVGISMG